MNRCSSLILIFVLVLSFPACMHHRSVTVSPATRSAKDASSSGSPTALSNFIQATLKISQENTAAAADALKQLHKRRPDLADLSRRVAVNGNEIDSRRLLAEAYMNEGLLPYAFQMYQEIQSIKPDDSLAELGVARVWDRWGNYGLAYEAAQRAVVLEPESADALEAAGHVHPGGCPGPLRLLAHVAVPRSDGSPDRHDHQQHAGGGGQAEGPTADAH